jgi:hypothetical protein
MELLTAADDEPNDDLALMANAVVEPELHTALKAAQPGSGTDAAAARFSLTTMLGENQP